MQDAEWLRGKVLNQVSPLAFSVAMTPPRLISELKISLKVLGLTCALDGVVGTSKSF